MSSISRVFGLQLWNLAASLIFTCSFSWWGSFLWLMIEIHFMLISSHHICIIHNCHSTVNYEVAYHAYSTGLHSTSQHSTAQHSTAQHIAAQHSTAHCSTAQHSTSQHSTAQRSTSLLHSTVQHITAHHCTFWRTVKSDSELQSL